MNQRVPGGEIGVRFTGDGGDTDDARCLAVGVIEKHLIALAHLIAHHVTGLIVAHPVPVIRLAGFRFQVIDTVHRRFRFH
jgi:hypothetical protein